jgi:hypothetical protein
VSIASVAVTLVLALITQLIPRTHAVLAPGVTKFFAELSRLTEHRERSQMARLFNPTGSLKPIIGFSFLRSPGSGFLDHSPLLFSGGLTYHSQKEYSPTRRR